MENDVIRILNELAEIAKGIPQSNIDALAEELIRAKRIFAAGRGRSGLISRMFAMRLMHLGLSAFSVDEVVTPAIRENDLLLVCSGSGNISSLKDMSDKALEMGAQIYLVTANLDSYIAKKANNCFEIPAFTPRKKVNSVASIQPMGSQFEQLLMVVLDATVIKLMKLTNMTEKEMLARHANLE
jgi:6-phospho-3-hexuloisomerase